MRGVRICIIVGKRPERECDLCPETYPQMGKPSPHRRNLEIKFDNNSTLTRKKKEKTNVPKRTDQKTKKRYKTKKLIRLMKLRYLVGTSAATDFRDEALQLGDEVGNLVVGNPGSFRLPRTRPPARHYGNLPDKKLRNWDTTERDKGVLQKFMYVCMSAAENWRRRGMGWGDLKECCGTGYGQGDEEAMKEWGVMLVGETVKKQCWRWGRQVHGNNHWA